MRRPLEQGWKPTVHPRHEGSASEIALYERRRYSIPRVYFSEERTPCLPPTDCRNAYSEYPGKPCAALLISDSVFQWALLLRISRFLQRRLPRKQHCRLSPQDAQKPIMRSQPASYHLRRTLFRPQYIETIP